MTKALANISSVPRRLVRLARNPVHVGLRALNRRYYVAANGEDRPAFYNIDKTYPCLRLLDQSYEVIREEMESVLNYKARIPRYHDLVDSEQYISGTIDPEKAWRVFMLSSTAGIPRSNQLKCPRTTALLKKIPN